MSQESSAILPAATTARSGAAYGVTLDSFVASLSDSDGVELRRLSALDTLDVQTRNSVYRIHLIDPHTGDAVISGGTFFPANTRVTISGATFGGSMLKCGVILIGCLLEIAAEGYRVTTTRVRAIVLNPPSVSPNPS